MNRSLIRHHERKRRIQFIMHIGKFRISYFGKQVVIPDLQEQQTTLILNKYNLAPVLH